MFLCIIRTPLLEVKSAGENCGLYTGKDGISILSFFSKIVERIMYNHIVDCMDSNCSIYKYQFGFRQRHSTQQAIITLVEKITSSLDHGDLVIGVFLDLKRLLILLITEYY